MDVLWGASPQTANQVVEALASRTDWKPKTIHTLLRRLALKGALRYQKQGREYLFEPAITAQSCLQDAGRTFLDRRCQGRLAPFLACLLKAEKLTAEEITELKSILDQKKP